MSENMNTRTGRRRAKEQSKATPKKKKTGIFKKLLIAMVVFFTVLAVAGGITVFSMIATAPPLNEDRLMLAQSTEILDQHDASITLLEAVENRIYVNINDIPELVEDAFIAVEDVRFREHFGVDVRRMFGAVAANVTGGFGAEGASTITQQVVKNLFLSPEKTISRKVQEQYLAIKLEQQYSKNQILEMYLNAIYFGGGAYGVQQAAITYFSKENLEDLTIEDAALLAGLPQRPNHFNPLNNPEAAEKRRNTVIALMERHGKITSEEAQKARAVSVQDQLNPAKREASAYQAFIDQVITEVESLEGITTSDIFTAGLKIYTTLDPDAQTHVEKVLQTDEFITTYPSNEDFQAGVTLIDTATGQIKAIGNGRHQTGVQRGFSFATAKKQPGSTIKPVLDYGPAIEHLKWSTGKVIVDEPHTYSDGTEIRNHNRNYAGPVTMRKALADSLNIPAIKALQEVGLENARDFASTLGIPFEDNRIYEPYGIGGFTTGISTFDLAGSYAAFGNEGVYIEPHTVRKIEFPDGKVINMAPEPVVAMSDYTAFMISDMLKTVVTNGTGTHANIPNLPLAGKTGTTNFQREDREKYKIPDGGVPDVWFAGYTTRYTAAVWTGYDRKGEGNYLINNDRRLAQQIFKAIMEEVSRNIETPDFNQPDSVVRVGVERRTGLLPSPFTPQSEIVYEYFVKGTEPTRVSEAFQSIPKPSDFKVGYNEDADQIILTWGYPSNQKGAVTFNIMQSIDDGGFEPIYTTKDMQHIITSPTPGATYRFQVIAIADEDPSIKSDPAQGEVKIPVIEIEEPIEEEPEQPIEPPVDEDEELPIDLIPEPEPDPEDDEETATSASTTVREEDDEEEEN
ncbi:penicillin-binding protein 1A [Alkalihalobacterium chitinilyticum]|uniref:PBP1A family penicillin-binding protein n=1 Tax=Alkalihalobacterium chitinilyticum TaxID=2980103 RepID=A0ABT5V8U1_9BACI|nr:penicillin-binding protein 1A [Alkalihalobacterium chitinilyticum]MDE5411877.1 PBP1A family penicillin-binding protein [Alkalihalobacterium chitinilyticum]